ncbi:MAG TPA: HIT family protein [Candidatus Omnitrophica bacterium]|nr:HIT family protein [Candidatus Omnitrophota bacterium]
MNENCQFCRIINREIKSYIVFEDEVSLAFLDHRPLFSGHSLLLPKKHYQTLTDLPSEVIGPLFTNAQILARAIEEALDAEGSFVAINNRVSQSVPHLHIHIVPRRRYDGLKGFFWPRHPYKDGQDIRRVQEAIQSAVTRIQAGGKK